MKRRHFPAEEQIRAVLEELRGEESITEVYRREGIVQNFYYAGETSSVLSRNSLETPKGQESPTWGAISQENKMQNIMSHFRPALAMLVLLAGGIGLAPSARASILSISGAAFIQQCPCAPSGNLPEVNKGVLVPTDQSKLYAAVDFPTDGQKICSLSLVYQDINAKDTMTARLFRKAFVVGGNPFNNPTLIVAASSASGVVNTVRKTTTKTVTPPAINETTGFYFVEVSVPTINLNLLGLQIDHRPTCP